MGNFIIVEVMLNYMENNLRDILKVYYSHPKWMYNTREEKDAIRTIKNFLGKDVEILNPRDYDENPDFAELKKRKGMSVCFKLIDQTDCVVFQRFCFPEQFRNFVLDYLERVDEYGVYMSRLSPDLRSTPKKLQHLITDKTSVITPGVAKEVNYALRVNKKVYELREELKTWNKKVRSDFKEPWDPLYRTFSLMIKAYKDNRHGILFPPFWWLAE